jgi:hypothetical protein
MCQADVCPVSGILHKVIACQLVTHCGKHHSKQLPLAQRRVNEGVEGTSRQMQNSMTGSWEGRK